MMTCHYDTEDRKSMTYVSPQNSETNAKIPKAGLFGLIGYTGHKHCHAGIYNTRLC